MIVQLLSFGLLLRGSVHAQGSSSPHDYPDIPTGDYGPDWQKYFQVTQALPNVTFAVGRNWAGNIAVDRPGFPNDTLFFWAFEREKGSLTANAGERESEPWGIWLNGGPGYTSLIGLMQGNGPIHIAFDGSVYANNYSWSKIADYFWLDQPVGVGFSTASPESYISDEDEMARDFWNFVANLVKVFPSLATRPLYLTGESFGETYIAYIMKGYFSMLSPPAKLAKAALTNEAIYGDSAYLNPPVVSVIETFPQLIGYDPDVYNYFVEQTHLCGYDLNLTYPQQGGHFPSLDGKHEARSLGTVNTGRKSVVDIKKRLRNVALHSTLHGTNHTKRSLGRRSLEGRANGTLDPWYECDLFNELWDYALNYTFPRNTDYEIADPDDVAGVSKPAPGHPVVFFDNPRTVAALHAPTGQLWWPDVGEVFQGAAVDRSPKPIVFFEDLAVNASAHDVAIVIYSGNDDTQDSHWGSEVVIQNTTFGGIQGFSRKPSTEWTMDDGSFAGIVHQERNWTYVLVYGAGHRVSESNPAAAFILAREFIFGSNQTGLVTSTSSVAIGGENANLTGASHDIVVAAPQIVVGTGATTATVIAPSATIAAWDGFLATRIPSSSGTSSSASASSTAKSKNAATRAHLPQLWLVITQLVWLLLL